MFSDGLLYLLKLYIYKILMTLKFTMYTKLKL